MRALKLEFTNKIFVSHEPIPWICFMNLFHESIQRVVEINETEMDIFFWCPLDDEGHTYAKQKQVIAVVMCKAKDAHGKNKFLNLNIDTRKN